MKPSYLILLTIVALSCSSPEPEGNFFESEGIALGGYDPVAYFEIGDATQGNENIASILDGRTYRFLNEEHKILFESNPEKYLPAYGGWCAYAVAENSIRMSPDPTMWKIQNDQLLLFYDNWMTTLTGSLLEEWNGDPDEYEIKADGN